jgi:hypothetical protein
MSSTSLIPETHGVMVYQEQLQRMYQQLTGCSGPEAEEFRKNVAKKKKQKIEKAYLPFIESAGAKIGKENAEGGVAVLHHVGEVRVQQVPRRLLRRHRLRLRVPEAPLTRWSGGRPSSATRRRTRCRRSSGAAGT